MQCLLSIGRDGGLDYSTKQCGGSRGYKCVQVTDAPRPYGGWQEGTEKEGNIYQAEIGHKKFRYFTIKIA